MATVEGELGRTDPEGRRTHQCYRSGPQVGMSQGCGGENGEEGTNTRYI